jgi:hypothetical protein
MNESIQTTIPKPSKKLIWAGWTISILVSLLFAMSAVMKFTGGQAVQEGLAHLGMPESLIIPLGILESVCLVIYLIPNTAVLGAVLLTGYLGGAICTHLRVGDAIIMPVIIGGLVWLGIYLREKRLWALLPLRTKNCPTQPSNQENS